MNPSNETPKLPPTPWRIADSCGCVLDANGRIVAVVAFPSNYTLLHLLTTAPELLHNLEALVENIFADELPDENQIEGLRDLIKRAKGEGR